MSPIVYACSIRYGGFFVLTLSNVWYCLKQVNEQARAGVNRNGHMFQSDLVYNQLIQGPVY